MKNVATMCDSHKPVFDNKRPPLLCSSGMRLCEIVSIEKVFEAKIFPIDFPLAIILQHLFVAQFQLDVCSSWIEWNRSCRFLSLSLSPWKKHVGMFRCIFSEFGICSRVFHSWNKLQGGCSLLPLYSLHFHAQLPETNLSSVFWNFFSQLNFMFFLQAFCDWSVICFTHFLQCSHLTCWILMRTHAQMTKKIWWIPYHQIV